MCLFLEKIRKNDSGVRDKVALKRANHLLTKYNFDDGAIDTLLLCWCISPAYEFILFCQKRTFKANIPNNNHTLTTTKLITTKNSVFLVKF